MPLKSGHWQVDRPDRAPVLAKSRRCCSIGPRGTIAPVATDTSGKFRFKLNKDGTKADIALSVNDGVRIQQAHLHCALAGVNGPIVVFLAGLNAAGYNVDGKWISNVTLTDSSISNNLCGDTLSNLASFMRAGMVYVNVHSVANPGGHIRGQVEPSKDD